MAVVRKKSNFEIEYELNYQTYRMEAFISFIPSQRHFTISSFSFVYKDIKTILQFANT